MSATMVDELIPFPERAPGSSPPNEAEPTMDLHDEGTSDLAPATVDVADVARRAGEEDSIELSQPIAREQLQPAASEGSARAAALSPGSVLQDRYLIEALLGSGGVSLVYRARDMQSSDGAARNRQVALKTPRPELHDAERARTRLVHEYEHTTALDHPNIVRALELHADAEPPFMTMELIEGRPLSAVLRDANRRLPFATTQRILGCCAKALAHAHARGVVHGDFKPGNVFITRDQNAKVIDFGAAAASSSGESRIAAGTPAYASPEVLSGETPEVRDDVFSFACVAYELITGKHPFERRSSLQARDDGVLPARAWSLSAPAWLTLLSGLSWAREQRPANVQAIFDALAPSEPPDRAEGAAREPPSVARRELPDELMPKQRSWGFFVFLACAFAVTFIATQRQNDRTADTPTMNPATAPAPAIADRSLGPTGLMGAPAGAASAGSSLRAPLTSADSATSAAPPPASTTSDAPPAPPQKPPSVAASEITFESTDIVTSEGSVAAVFLIKRSQPLSGRTRVQWRAVSGTADAGIDFASNAAGSVEFADGQAQRAIYVPLRNDLLKEEAETFTVRLQSPQGARLGKNNKVTATIRDDD